MECKDDASASSPAQVPKKANFAFPFAKSGGLGAPSPMNMQMIHSTGSVTSSLQLSDRGLKDDDLDDCDADDDVAGGKCQDYEHAFC
mmetsp:Transcript_32812/g.43252  ORF Transcript_32812/g.43252 Transcript_32812/m.43252 type:complete len:87 (+) Transcript_32812:57-317(+)